MKYAMILPMIAVGMFTAMGQNIPVVEPEVRFGVQGDIGFVSLPGPEVNGSTPLDEVYELGFGGGVHCDIELVSFAFRITADYATFSPDNEKYQQGLPGFVPGSTGSDFTVDGGTVNIISLNVNGKFPFLPLPIVSPYLTGGIGFAKINADASQISYLGIPATPYPGFDSGTSASANIGLGVDLNVFLSLFVEAKYIWIFDEGQSSRYLPISLGVNL